MSKDVKGTHIIAKEYGFIGDMKECTNETENMGFIKLDNCCLTRKTETEFVVVCNCFQVERVAIKKGVSKVTCGACGKKLTVEYEGDK